MLSLNELYKNRKVSLTIFCKYKYFDSTVQRAGDRRQKFYFCRLPFAVNVKLNLSSKEFKRLLRQRRRQRRLKNELYFTYESRDTLTSFTLFITVKAITKLNLGHRDKFEIEFQKINRRSSRSSDNAEFDHFTVLFCRGRQRNVH